MIDPATFVAAVRVAVCGSAVSSEIGYIAKPPGRRVPADIAALSSWYNDLSPEDKSMLGQMLERVARSATFGCLCVSDGCRAIEDGPDKGTLELRSIGKTETALAGPGAPMLHELFAPTPGA